MIIISDLNLDVHDLNLDDLDLNLDDPIVNTKKLRPNILNMIVPEPPTHRLICGDNLAWLPGWTENIDCIFADPPDNIGLGYDQYNDNLAYREYVDKIEEWVSLFPLKTPTTWFSFNSKWTLEFAESFSRMVQKGWNFKPCVQTFSFYQHNKHDLGDAHRPLWRLTSKDAQVYPDQIKIPSWRQLNGDKRAASGGKVPGNNLEFERNTKPLPNLTLGEINRVLSKIKVAKDSECWEWTASKRGGYGRVNLQGELYGVTRLIWRLCYGSDPGGGLILHKCDNPSCCNPNHLFIGSDSHNNQDKEMKGRGNHPVGKDVATSKLTEADVLDIFHSPQSNKDLAAQYGVSDRAINCIKLGKTWSHITSDPNSDVFRFTRVTGNSKQRRKWHKTQLHEGLIKRCVLLSTLPGGHVLDPFGGTGTTLRVCREIGRRCTLIEIDRGYCEKIAEEHEMTKVTSDMWELECSE